MSAYTAIFNGHDLSQLFVISPPERTLTTWEPDLVAMPNGYGSLFAGTKAQAMEITLRLTTFAETLDDRLADLRTLSGWLFVDEPKKLAFTDESYDYTTIGGYERTGNLYRMALPTGTPKVTHTLNAATAEVKFICPDSRAYLGYGPSLQGVEDEFFFAANEEYDGYPMGNAPTETRIFLENVCGDSDGVFQMEFTCYDAEKFGGAITLDVASNANAYIMVDSEDRTYSNDMSLEPYPLDNDWIQIVGGHRTTARVTRGSCETDVFYYPRWW